jgi:hypothetical protein
VSELLGATPNEIGLAALVVALVIIALKGPRVGEAVGAWIEARSRGRDDGPARGDGDDGAP